MPATHRDSNDSRCIGSRKRAIAAANFTLAGQILFGRKGEAAFGATIDRANDERNCETVSRPLDNTWRNATLLNFTGMSRTHSKPGLSEKNTEAEVSERRYADGRLRGNADVISGIKHSPPKFICVKL